MTRKRIVTGFGIALAGALAATTLLYTMGPLGPANAANSETYRQLNLFGDVFDRIRSDYVDQPDDAALIDAAISGMLTALDPHSSYMNAQGFQEMQVQTRGEFGGLGIEVTMERGFVKVVAPIDDTPAARAGIMANDFITHIDGEQIINMTLGEAVDKMRGLVNTPIVLTIVREGTVDPFDVRLVRDIIRIRSVRFEVDKDVGYVRITTFNEQTQEGLHRALRELREKIGDGLKGFVLDLRNNPGGLLDQAIYVSDTFLDRGEIVSTRGRNAEQTQRYNADAGDLAEGLPVVVLINGGSASASEIVAGALQDHQRATILGTRSFGKGSVQTIIPLGGMGAMRLTTARYYTPSGRSIQAKGIDPDILVEQELPETAETAESPRGESTLPGHIQAEDGSEQSGSSSYVPQDREEDKQLIYALNLLRGIDVGDAPAAVQPAPEADAETEPNDSTAQPAE
jgi:carboxyl-terminal processing protease